MRALPVYQMALGEDGNGNAGLVFTSEQDDDTQSFIFTIPIPDGYRHVFHFMEEMPVERVVFPFLLGDKYYNLIGKISFPEIVFQVPEVETKIVFELADVGFLGYFPSFIRHPHRYNKYVGKHKNLIGKYEGFWAIVPTDMSELNDLYVKYKGVFVGFTPNFGDFNSQNNEQELEIELT